MPPEFDIGEFNPTWEQITAFEEANRPKPRHDIYTTKPVGKGPLDDLINQGVDWLGEAFTSGDPLDQPSGTPSYIPESKVEDLAPVEGFQSTEPSGTEWNKDASAARIVDDMNKVKVDYSQLQSKGTPASTSDITSDDAKSDSSSLFGDLSAYDKFKLITLGGEMLGDIVSYGPKMTAAIGDIQARGALGMAPGSAIDPIKEVGPSSYMPDVAEVFAGAEQRKYRKSLQDTLSEIVKGQKKEAGEEDEYGDESGSIDEIISGMGPLQGMDSSVYEVKHKPSKLMLPKKKKEGAADTAGYDRDSSLPSDATILGVDASEVPAFTLDTDQAVSGEEDTWDHQLAVDIANKALEEGDEGMPKGPFYQDYDLIDQLQQGRNPASVRSELNKKAREKAVKEGLPLLPTEDANPGRVFWFDDKETGERRRGVTILPEDFKTTVYEGGLGPVDKKYATEGDRRHGHFSTEDKQQTQQVTQDPGPQALVSSGPENLEWNKDALMQRALEQEDRVRQLSDDSGKPGEPGKTGQPGEPGKSPSDALAKIAAVMSVSDKLDFLDDRKENEKVKAMEKEMASLKQQQRSDEDIEWMKLQQQKQKDLQFAPTPITPIRWS